MDIINIKETRSKMKALEQSEKSPEALFELYGFIEQLIEMNAKYDETDEIDQQVDFLLRSEQEIITELAETSSASVFDLKHKIAILFGETGMCGRRKDDLLPVELLAQSILTDLEKLTANDAPPRRMAESA